MRSRRSVAIAVLCALAAVCPGCGGSASGGRPDLTVSAAASLQRAFTAYGARFRPARARFSFAGSDQLAAQIESGIRPDVFASANTKLPDALFARRLVERPVVFTANRLVIAVPAGTSRVRSVADLARPGVTIAVGSATVPVGAYTRRVLAHLPGAERAQILRNVRSDEPDVAGVIAKVASRAVDAGFVYATDVRAAGGQARAAVAQARAVGLPAALQPRVEYAAAVVRGSPHAAQARAFIAGLLRGAGRRDLLAAGFLPVSR